jgi:hypothetical protein
MSLYERLPQELSPYQRMMGQAADTIMDEDVSRYPIFAIHQLELELGILLVQRSEGGAKWSIHATTLEEMVSKKLVQMNRVDDFRRVYKNPRDFFCLFALSDEGAQFIFLPREDEPEY